MALMLPSTIPLECPLGEREIFHRLRDDPATSSWIVIHSLDIANHVSQISGEADFIVIIPNKGIICVEVKSHTVIRKVEGNWYYGKNLEPDARGPFKQAASAMHSIRNYLSKQRPDLKHIVFWSAVFFPYATAKMTSGEWHSWQLIDRSRFFSEPISKLFLSIIENARAFLAVKSTIWFSKDTREPYLEQCKEIAKILRPNFEFFESASGRKKRLQQELKIYTEEQLFALDRMESNLRIVYTGPAGTGKTLIAIEAARRAYNAGRKTLLLCYNSLLGKWLKEQTQPISSHIKTATIHGFLMETSGIEFPPQGGLDAQFWAKDLPDMAGERIIERLICGERFFDEIIADEAQDILLDKYLDFLDLILNGGLAAGRWRFFGDFEKQAIYASGHLTLKEFLEGRGNNAPEYRLRENCRNTPRVTAYVELLGGLSPGYRKILRPDDGMDPQWCYYSNQTEQSQQVVKVIKDFVSEGFELKDIFLLSPKIDSCGAAIAREKDWRNQLVPADKKIGNQAGYCTIQAFKGLESPIIILTDIEQLDTKSRVDVFYVGITRSLQRLAIFVANSARRSIKEILS